MIHGVLAHIGAYVQHLTAHRHLPNFKPRLFRGFKPEHLGGKHNLFTVKVFVPDTFNNHHSVGVVAIGALNHVKKPESCHFAEFGASGVLDWARIGDGFRFRLDPVIQML